MDLKQGKFRDCHTVILVDNPHNKFSQNMKNAVSKVDPRNSDGKEAKKREDWKEYIQRKTKQYDMLEDVSQATADRYMQALDRNGYLTKDGEIQTASKPTPKYKIEKSKLRRDLLDSDNYLRELPLFRHLINKGGDF